MLSYGPRFMPSTFKKTSPNRIICVKHDAELTRKRVIASLLAAYAIKIHRIFRISSSTIVDFVSCGESYLCIHPISSLLTFLGRGLGLDEPRESTSGRLLHPSVVTPKLNLKTSMLKWPWVALVLPMLLFVLVCKCYSYRSLHKLNSNLVWNCRLRSRNIKVLGEAKVGPLHLPTRNTQDQTIVVRM